MVAARLPRSGRSQAGFVLVQAFALIPLVMTVIAMAAGAQFVLKRKLKAQSECVREATALQEDLRKTLDALIKMNPQAARLRISRQKADQALTKAVASGYAPAIAAATAVRTAVILAQTAFHARQLALISRAGAQRMEHHRSLAMSVGRFTEGAVNSQTFFPLPLAVRPVPATSLSPDYETVPNFEFFQQHRFSYRSILSPPFLKNWNIRQETVCSLTLEEKEGKWRPQILAASALSKLR